MTSASACEHMWSIAGWIHNKRRNRLAQPNVEKAVRAHGNLVLRKAMLLSRQQKVAWDSQTHISEPDRHTNEQGVDDSDDDDIDSDWFSMCVCVCVCVCVCIYVYVYISVYITSAYMYMYQWVRLRSSHAGLKWHVPWCMHTILVYHCNKQASNVLLSIQFDTNVSQLLRRVIPPPQDTQTNPKLKKGYYEVETIFTKVSVWKVQCRMSYGSQHWKSNWQGKDCRTVQESLPTAKHDMAPV